MNNELQGAADDILVDSGQSLEFKRRLVKLLENVTTSNYTDADVRQIIDLADFSEED